MKLKGIGHIIRKEGYENVTLIGHWMQERKTKAANNLQNELVQIIEEIANYQTLLYAKRERELWRDVVKERT